MHKQIVLFFGAFVYYSIALYGLYIFDASLLVTSLFLFGLPAYALAHFSAAPVMVLLSTVSLGIGVSVLFEGIANIYNLWITPSIGSLNIFGFISIEMIFAFVLQILFLVLLYELLFDDGEYTQSSSMARLSSFGVFALGSILLVVIFQYFFNDLFLSSAYLWLIGILIASSIAALSVYKALTLRLFDKLVNFSLIASVPLLIASLLATANGHKVFDGSTYIGLVSFANISIPFEELMLIFALPFFIATIYELYLDDRI